MMKKFTQFNLAIFLFLCLTYTSSSYANLLSESVIKSDLDVVVADVCNKKLVLLGEDVHHGSGKTIEVKAALVQRLVNECHFSAVFFESSVYEFLNFEQAVATASASPQQLSQSIGGLWNKAKQFTPLINFFYQNAIEGKVRLAGIDAQFSANQPFSQNELPKRFATYLQNERAKDCEVELDAYLNWKYDDISPFNNATKNRLKTCVGEVQKTISQLRSHNISNNNRDLDNDQLMVENFAQLLQFPEDDIFNMRDKTMANNIAWHVSKLPKNAKIIVWCANSHAAKTLTLTSSGKIPMGFYLQRTFKEKIVSIGFSALTGHFGRSELKKQNINPSALEQSTLTDESKNLHYINLKKLVQIGSIDAQVMQYNKVQRANWSKIFDGMIVLRQEEPLELMQ